MLPVEGRLVGDGESIRRGMCVCMRAYLGI